MKYFSLFSGVGGFELGINKAYEDSKDLLDPSEQQHEEEDSGTSVRMDANREKRLRNPVCVGLSEIDKHASAVLKYRFPRVKNYGDITKIDWSAVPDFDLLVGGSPCQSFSIAGKRKGLEGASGLFMEYLRCLQEKKPEHFIWENVKGVLSSSSGRDFAFIISSFSEAGYSLWWQVLNAKDFGVPQNRERIFIVGTRTGSPREVFFERKSDAGDSDGRVVAGTVTFRYPASQREGAYIEETRHSKGAQSQRVRGIDGVSSTLQAGGGGMGAKTGLYKTGSRIRKLTPKECERLMGWPNDWTEFGAYDNGHICAPISDTQRYKMCGNGVVSSVVTEVIKAHILSCG